MSGYHPSPLELIELIEQALRDGNRLELYEHEGEIYASLPDPTGMGMAFVVHSDSLLYALRQIAMSFKEEEL